MARRLRKPRLTRSAARGGGRHAVGITHGRGWLFRPEQPDQELHARQAAPAEVELDRDEEADAAKKPLREWRITPIRAKGQYLGRVEAPDAETAIKRAIEEFGVDEAHRSRLIAQPVD